MNIIIKKLSPVLFILLGLIILFIIHQPIPAGICFLIGIVMALERIWPERWEADEK